MSEELGERLRRFRAEHGKTQEEAAAAAGVKPITISRWERGIVDAPDPNALARLATFYGTTVDKLMTGNGVADQMPSVATPDSFRFWKDHLAPKGILTTVIEQRMIQTGLRYSIKSAWRWSNVLAEVLVDLQEHEPPPRPRKRRGRHRRNQQVERD